MARVNAPLQAFNRGIISPKSLARVDLDRVKLSAEVYNNWFASTQGSMSIRPGTQHFGSSLNDTGAYFMELIASTDDVAMPEFTDSVMRVWLGDDAHALALLSRPPVDTTVSLSDTGWSNASTGGSPGGSSASTTDIIPTMTGATTNGVTITASSENAISSAGPENNDPAWQAADDSDVTKWSDTGDGSGSGGSTLPSWWNVDFGSGNTKAVGSYSIRAGNQAPWLDNAPKTWRLIGSNFDTGTYATDTGKWILENEPTSQTGWALSEKRTFTITDTGTPGPWRHWRLFFTAVDGDTELFISEIEMFAAEAAAADSKVVRSSGTLTLNATAIGSLAKATKRVIISDTGTEHALAIHVSRGPVTLRVGSTSGDDDYIRETNLGTGYHNLAFTPTTNFHITLQSNALVSRIVSSVEIADSGTVEIATPWTHSDLDAIRYDQSADVAYVDCDGVRSRKIERRGTGRSWSVVNYEPTNGPFLAARSTSAKLAPHRYSKGNTTLTSDIPFFTSDHVGAIFRLFHQGQNGTWTLGAVDAVSDPVEMTGISDTGTPSSDSERRIVFQVTGTYTGQITVERSIDGKDIGFKTAPASFAVGSDTGWATDTGTFNLTIDDPDDNLKVWYRVRMSLWTSGAASVFAAYGGGGKTGLCRVTGYNNNMSVDIETETGFSKKDDTGGQTDNWQEGYWSDARGFPSAVALHGGRLAHAQGGSLFLSVADDFENFDEATTGDAGPIIRTLGSGPVDSIQSLVSLLRLIIHTDGAELALRSSSLDEPVTPSNSSAGTFSTNGSAPVRAVKIDNRAIFVQRSRQRVFLVAAGGESAFGDYEAAELTLLVPDLLVAGVASVAIQRQPDTRIWCVLDDGTVAILTYEPQEEVVCWTTFETDGVVERVMVLPGVSEDAVYLHVKRTVNGQTKRFLEKMAMASECQGDTGLNWIMDCASSYTDTGRTTTLVDIAPHLGGSNVVVWGSLDSGSTPHVDMSPDTGSDFSQRLWAVDTGGDIALSGLTDGLHHAVAGLPFQSDWRSSKLAYGAQAGTALAQVKRVAQTALILYKTHARSLFLGDDTGALDPLPRVIDGEVVDQDRIFETLDMVAFPTPGTHKTDPRLHIRAKAPRPATVLAAVPSPQTNERL